MYIRGFFDLDDALGPDKIYINSSPSASIRGKFFLPFVCIRPIRGFSSPCLGVSPVLP